MIRSLAVGLTAATLLVSPRAPCARPLKLDIDACVDADRQEVLRLLEVELGAALDAADAKSAVAPAPELAISCTSERDVVEVRDPAQPGARPRVLDLRALGAEARRARARELVLVIREMLEARGEQAPPPRSRPARPLARPKARRSRSVAELSLLGGAEKYSGGYAQLGPTLGFRVLPLSLLVIEARAGVRMSPTLSAPAGQIGAKGLAAALGLGLDLFPIEGSAGLVVLTRLQYDRVFIEGASELEGSVGRSADGWALVASLASSAWVALSPRWRLTLEPALLLPFQELAIVDRGRPIASLSGLGAAASIGLALRL